MKTIPIPGQIRRPPKHLKFILGGFGVLMIGVFLYYLVTSIPMFGRAATPTISTQSATNIAQTTATMNGSITDLGGKPLQSRGFEYGTTTSYGQTISRETHMGPYVRTWGSFGTGNSEFDQLSSLTTDSNGNVFTIDYTNNRVQKFSSVGFYITQWGMTGAGESQFQQPTDIATDTDGNVYVADSGNNRIQKFSNSGAFLDEWGGTGTGDGQLSGLSGIAINSLGENLAVANGKVQKFSSTGDFISSVTVSGYDIAVDADDNMYIGASTQITKYSSNGTLITQWGSAGTAPGQFSNIGGISVDISGNIYVADWFAQNGRLQKFKNDGTYIAKWDLSGRFDSPLGIEADSAGNVFVADSYTVVEFRAETPVGTFSLGATPLTCNTTYHYRAFATNEDGTSYGDDNSFTTSACAAVLPTVTTGAPTSVTQTSATLQGSISVGGAGWQNSGGNEDQISSPNYSATDSQGNVFIVSQDSQIRKYTRDGVHVVTWGSKGTGDVNMDPEYSAERQGLTTAYIGPIAIDSQDNVYAVNNSYIIKYDSSGQFIAKWGGPGSADGLFDSAISSIVFDSSDNLYVAEADGWIQKLDNTGAFALKWQPGTTSPKLAADSAGNIYSSNEAGAGCCASILKFSSLGVQTSSWPLVGSTPIDSLFVDRQDSVYAVRANNRIEKINSSGLLVGTWTSPNGDAFIRNASIGINGNIFASDSTGRVNVLPAALPKGFEFGTTTSYGTTIQDTGLLSATLSHSISSLSCGNTYHYRAFATYTNGTTYGDDRTITTAPCTTTPLVTTDPATSIGSTTATLNGTINGVGESEITARGFEYGTTDSYGQDVSESVIKQMLYAGQFGSEGSTQGMLNSPQDVAVDSEGNIYVADTTNVRVQKFDSAGNFILMWGSAGSGAGEFGVVKNIAVDSLDNIYVADSSRFRVQKFDSDGNFILMWGANGTGNGQFFQASSVTIDSNDNVYVTDNGQDRIQKFDTSGNYIAKWGSNGSGNGQFLDPNDVAVDRSGNIFVADMLNNRIQKFDSSLTYVSQWGVNGIGPGQLAYPTHLSTDYFGNVYVSELQNDRIQKFSNTGSYLSLTAGAGTGDGQVDRPSGLFIDPSGSMYVADYTNDRIQKFDAELQTGPFSLDISSLTCETTYHFRAYATNASGTGYGEDLTFDTPACPAAPTVTTEAASAISQTSATLNGTVTSLGSSALTARGFQYGADTSYGTSTNDSVSATGAFNYVLTLPCGTTRHFRAYATNDTGTAYGDDMLLTTAACAGAPTVLTNPATSITTTASTLNGDVTNDGSSSITARGFQYGLSTSYGSTFTHSASTVGSFSGLVNSLTCGTTYNFRAYATNAVGTSYGIDRSFTTAVCPLPPEIIITAPENNQVFGATVTSVDLAAEAKSVTSTIEKVDFFVDGTYVGTVTAAPYTLTALGLPVGAHTLVTRAYDVLGVSTDAIPVTFYVQPPAGEPPIPDVPTPPLPPPATPTVQTPTEQPASDGVPNDGRSPAVVNAGGTVTKKNWLDDLWAHRLYYAIPFALILLLLIMAALYARQAMREYKLRKGILATFERFDRTLKAANDYLTITSHYLNTPVAIMNGAVDLIAELKKVPESSITHIRSKLSAFATAVTNILADNQVSATQASKLESKSRPKSSNPFKDKAVWAPSLVVLICLVLAELLFIQTEALTSSTGRVVIEFLLFLFAFVLLGLARHYKEASIVARQFAEKEIANQTKLFEKRRSFIDETRGVLDDNYNDLVQVGTRIKSVPESRLYFNGLAMLANLRKGLTTIHAATDMSATAPLLDTSTILNNLTKDFATKAADKKLDFTVTAATGLGAHIRPEEFQQLMSSVVDNAIKFSNQKGTVDVVTRKRFGKLVIKVSDNGVGIAKDKIGELMQPFARATDASRFDYEGVGLSLYMDKVILARLGGDIKLNSTLNKGTTVTITLPTVSPEEAASAPAMIAPNTNGVVVA